ncbi:glycerate kinase, partial [Isoptericola sp. b490]|uniref:glycerate kinase n=1 Tax=Actinotalea lenta TaxID=3064654 RepID=UPI0027123B35
ARGAPADRLEQVPLGDGGSGLVAAVHRGVGGDLVPVTVAGTAGEPTPAGLLRLPDGTVVVEVAEVLGARATSGARAPVSSAPAAGLLDAALELDPRRVVMGVGGLVAHDAGAGLLAALGGHAQVADGGAQLEAAMAAGSADLPALLEATSARLAGRDLIVAVDTEVALLGLHGASALLAVPDATALTLAPAAAQGLEQAVGRWVHALGSGLGPGRVRAAASARGAGAGGGLAFGLALLGARLVPGPQVVASLVGLDSRVADADLVLTATAVLDPHVLHDSALAAASAAAAAHALPVVVVSGEAVLGRREWAAQGLSGVYPLTDGSTPWQELDDVPGALVDRAARVARTWSR